MQNYDKIKGVVDTIDKLHEARKVLFYALSPMGKARFNEDEIKPYSDKLKNIKDDLTQLQEDLEAEIYK